MFDNELRLPTKNIKSDKIRGKNLEYLKSYSKKTTSVVHCTPPPLV